jgi:hypothetical protein
LGTPTWTLPKIPLQFAAKMHSWKAAWESRWVKWHGVKKKCYPGSMVIYGPNGTVFQRFAGEQWEPVETWIQDWEVPQGWNPRFADEGVRPTTN